MSLFEPKDQTDRHLPPKVRPINSGTMVSNTALGSMQDTPAGAATIARTLPLGTKSGVEKLAKICHAAYHEGYLIGRNDFENGFNSLSRLKMLETTAALFPEGVSLMNFFYGSASTCFFN